MVALAATRIKGEPPWTAPVTPLVTPALKNPWPNLPPMSAADTPPTDKKGHTPYK